MDSQNKIQDLEQLAEWVADQRLQGKRVVHCHGVFDLVHPGHIRHLAAASSMGDVLVVTVTPDRFVNKGPGRPIFNQQLRAESLAALQTVSSVAINRYPTAVEAILLLRPDVYVKGSEYSRPENDVTGKIADEERAIQSVGGCLAFTDDITFSSSHLINRNFSPYGDEAAQWLANVRTQHPVSEVEAYIERARAVKVLVVGEAILDEYVFCDCLGKSNKDPVLAFKYRERELYAGGSLAVANHLAGLCDQVGLLCMLGDQEREEQFVRGSLRPNVQPFFSSQHNAPTIRKVRYVDAHTQNRTFELYRLNDEPLDGADESALLKDLDSVIDGYDLVVVTDYGHGMITDKVVACLRERARFLAVNTQANAGNRGFNTISKFASADYVCLAGHEVQLETRQRHTALSMLIEELARRIDCGKITVTMGRDGTLHYDSKLGFVMAPALAGAIVDRVGAGDAVLAITSLMIQLGAPWEIVGLLGNLAGAQVVGHLGNREKIDRVALTKAAIAALK